MLSESGDLSAGFVWFALSVCRASLLERANPVRTGENHFAFASEPTERCSIVMINTRKAGRKCSGSLSSMHGELLSIELSVGTDTCRSTMGCSSQG
jgi:hypothetical protein